MITLLLLLGGFICFALAAFGVASRVNLLAAGLALWILVPLIDAFSAVL
ncbi:hypothetical protein [Nonomuraea angiospora]|nr:hypothetical protein [Nonomuraea angiospora]MDX3110158.1 hypothetical protein [Nonomuraea angiospora]